MCSIKNSFQFLFNLLVLQLNFIDSWRVFDVQMKYKNIIKNIYNYSTDEYISRQKLKENILTSNLKPGFRMSEILVNRSRRQINMAENATQFGTCETFYTCEHNKDKVLANCYCDGQCSNFNDCCNDYDKNRDKNEDAIGRSNHTCRVYTRSDLYSYGRGYWMIKTCPGSFNNTTISNRCIAIRNDNVPVTGKSGIVYDNPFCAICNDEIEFVPWKVRVAINNPICQSDFPKTLITNENTQLIREFESLRNSICEFQYDTPLNDNPRICLLPETQIRQEICDAELATDFGGKGFRILSLNVLFSLGPPKIGEKNKCNDNQDYDQGSACGSGSGKCKKREVVSVENYNFNTTVTFISNFPLQVAQGREAVFLFMACIPFKHFGFKTETDKIKFLSSFYPLFEINGTKVHTLINMTIKIIVTKIYKVSDIFYLKSAMEKFQWMFLIRSQNIKIQRIWNASYYPMSDTFFHGSFLKDEFDYSEEIMESFLNTIDIQHNGFERNKFPNFCNASQESALNSYGKTIHLYCYNSLEKVIKPEDVKQNISASKTKHFQAVLTYLTLGLSSTAIIPTLVIQRYLQLTQTTPGHISENILVIIFIFNIMFMFGTGTTDYPMFCLLSSVTAHYLILSCFIWISIFVFHTLSTLRGLKQVNRGNRQVKQVFPKIFYAIGYLLPLVIILPSVIADICDCSSVQIGYTSNICFPTAYPANLVVFVGPVVLSVLVNLGGLVFAAWTLCRLNIYLSHKGITNSRSFVGVYIRLSVLSGLSWGVGVISEWLDNEILRFIFIIFTGTHGLLFCMCIISTKLVRDTIREKWYPKQGDEPLEMDQACGTIEDNGNNALENVSATDEL